MHNYHAAIGVFPPGRLRSMVDNNGRCFSAYAYMLPFLDQGPLYNAINFNLNPDNAPNAAVAGENGLQPENTTALVHEPERSALPERLLVAADRTSRRCTTIR